jgi:hypothetical protein
LRKVERGELEDQDCCACVVEEWEGATAADSAGCAVHSEGEWALQGHMACWS